MKYKTTRIRSKDAELLKILKESMGLKSLTDTLHHLIHKALCERYAYTKDGYLLPGTRVLAVEMEEEIPLTIKKIHRGDNPLGYEVVFTDGSTAINGGGFVWRLSKLAGPEEAKEERLHG